MIIRLIRIWLKYRRVTKYKRLYERAKRRNAFGGGKNSRFFKYGRFLSKLFDIPLFRCECIRRLCKICKTVVTHRESVRLLFFIIGLLFSWFLFIISYNFDSSSKIVLILKSISLVGITSLSMAFSLYLRTIVCLLLPIVLTSKGRYVIFFLIINILINGPVLNTRENLSKNWKAIKCIAKSLARQAVRLIKENPVIKFLISVAKRMNQLFREVEKSIKRTIKWIKDLIDSINEIFYIMATVMRIIGETLMFLFKWMDWKCHDAVDGIVATCVFYLSWFGHLCHVLRPVCWLHTFVVVVLEPTRQFFGQIYHEIFEYAIKRLSQYLTNAWEILQEKLESMFSPGIKLKDDLHDTSEESGNVTAGFRDIASTLDDRLSIFMKFLIVFTPLNYLLVFLCILRAWSYLKRFQLWDSFDNVYITSDIQKIDWQRAISGKQTILPLSFKMGKHYISPWSLTMTSDELRKLQNSLIIYTVFCGIIVFFLLLEYLIFIPIDQMRKFSIHSGTDFAIPGIKIYPKPESTPVASMVKSIPIVDDEPFENFTLAACTPDPIVPDSTAYEKISYLLFLAFLAITCEAYALRFRFMIAGFMYPARKFARAAWLYNRILSSMPAAKVENRSKIRSKVRGNSEIGKTSRIKRWMYANPCTAKIYDKLVGKGKICISCGVSGEADDTEHFTRCINRHCVAFYCLKCFDEVDRVCPVCETVAPSPEEYAIDTEIGSDDDDLDIDDFRYYYVDDWNPESNEDTSREPKIDYKNLESLKKGRPKDYSKYLRKRQVEDGPVDSDASTKSEKEKKTKNRKQTNQKPK